MGSPSCAWSLRNCETPPRGGVSCGADDVTRTRDPHLGKKRWCRYALESAPTAGVEVNDSRSPLETAGTAPILCVGIAGRVAETLGWRSHATGGRAHAHMCRSGAMPALELPRFRGHGVSSS